MEFMKTTRASAVIQLGEGPCFVKSTKQKLITKSSTEAELVALSDAMSQVVICSRDFLLAQGYKKTGPAIVYQDNISTMLMAKNGRSSSSDRTRHGR
jgi:hypothetical protein